MNLYTIHTEYRQLLEELYDEEGEVNETALAKLNENEKALEAKAIAVASYIKNMEAESNAMADAEKAISLRRKRLQKRAEYLVGYLQENMEKRGINKISCSWFDLTLKKCPHSVAILNGEVIPAEYIRTKIETSPDKVKMLGDLKNGVVIEGVELQQRNRLDIK